jgi:hypothetical protein
LKRQSLAIFSAAAALLLVPSCRPATQITLSVHTNVPCGDGSEWQGVAIYVGQPGPDVESTAATLVTHACDEQGFIGSLVVTPSGEKDSDVGLRVVAGITKNPEKCAEGAYEGCIVARRAVRFTPHDSLELAVELTADCVSIGCDATHSCIERRCVETRSIDETSVVAKDFGQAGATGAAGSGPGALPDDITGPSVRCGDNGVRCATAKTTTNGEVCCLEVDAEAGTTFGACLLPKDCPPTSVVLNCDDDTDCPERDPLSDLPSVCALSSTPDDPWHPTSVQLSDCRYAHAVGLGRHFALGLCQERKACADSRYSCRSSDIEPLNPLPGYFWCEIQVE